MLSRNQNACPKRGAQVVDSARCKQIFRPNADPIGNDEYTTVAVEQNNPLRNRPSRLEITNDCCTLTTVITGVIVKFPFPVSFTD